MGEYQRKASPRPGGAWDKRFRSNKHTNTAHMDKFEIQLAVTRAKSLVMPSLGFLRLLDSFTKS